MKPFLVAIIVAASMVVVLPSEATAGCPVGAPVTLQSPQVGTAQTYECKDLRITGVLTIASGGNLALEDSTVTFAKDPAGNAGVRVLAGGRLLLADDTIIRAAAGSTYAIVIDRDGRIETAFATLDAPSSFIVESSTSILSNLTIQGAAGTGITVRSASPTLRDVEVRGGVTGIRIEGTSAPSFKSIHVQDAAGFAVLVTGASTIVAADSFLEGDAGAVSLEGPATLTLRQAGIAGPQTLATLAASSLGSPRLILENTPVPPDRIQRGAGARLDVLWHVLVRVVQDDAAPGATIAGTTVTARDRLGNELPPVTVDAQGFAPLLLVPQASYVGPGPASSANNPWKFAARQGSSAAALEADIEDAHDSAATAIVIPLPLDHDQEAPQWTVAAPLRLVGATTFSSDGLASLSWEPANDKGDNQWPNRDVASYEILHSMPAGFYQLHRSAVASLDLTGLAAGTHRFAVRPVDLAGNSGQYSNEVSLTVDTTSPVIVVTSTPLPRATVSEPIGPDAPGMRDVLHFAAPFSLTAAASDEASAVTSLTYRVGPSGPFTAYSQAIPFANRGSSLVTFKAVNGGGAVAEVQKRVILDDQPPVLTLDIAPALPDGPAGWTRGSLSVNASAVDVGESGVASIRYRVDGADWLPLTRATPLDIVGQHELTVEAVDRAGNAAATTRLLRRDPNAPSIQLAVDGEPGQDGWFLGAVAVTALVGDNESSLAHVTHRVDGGLPGPFQNPIRIANSGVHVLVIRAVDAAGNERVREISVNIDRDPPIVEPPYIVALEGGRIGITWPGIPPMDLASGLAEVFLERTSAGGTVLQSVPIQVADRAALAGPYPSGTHRFRIRAVDLAGHEETTPWSQVSVAGAATLDADPSGETRRAHGTIRVALEAPSGFKPVEVQLFIDGRLRAATADEPFEFVWDSSTHANGQAEIELVAWASDGAQYRQTMVYDVQNGYWAAVKDNSALAAAATALAALAASVGGVAFFRARRWFA